jgi:alpha-glucosidase
MTIARIAVLAPMLLAVIGPAHARQAQSAPIRLASPDGSIVLSITQDADRSVHYAVWRDDEQVIARSLLRLKVRDADVDAPGVLQLADRRSIDRVWTPVAGKTAQARDHFNEMTVSLGAPTPEAVEIVARAYDDGIALRYVLPQSDTATRIETEETEFAFPANYQCTGLNIGRLESSFEGEFDPVAASRIREFNRYLAPLVCKTASGNTHFAITEADLAHYGGLYLSGLGSGLLGVRTQVSPRRDDPTLIAITPPGRAHTPWRVVMMADRTGDMLESTLIENLNPPSKIADTSWVERGKSAWDWWSGPYLPPPADAGMNMATLERYIDFAGEAGLDYMLIDEGWCLNSGIGGSAPPDADVTRTKPGIDMPALVAYAKARGVRLLLWVQWELLKRQMDAALAQYRDWGIAGIKVDFMNRNDQEMVEYYHDLMAKAAAQHLIVDMHGAYPPTGLMRTWPNYLTQEGVLGAEYNKWSRRITAEHNVTLAYTRGLLGPMDYTPGGFRNRTPETFDPVNSPPQVQTTRGAALAMYVVYESPLAMVSDSPDAYRNADGFDFIRAAPTTWDETRFLGGTIGESIAVARRTGDAWYIGAMTDAEPRTLKLPLDFLGQGRFVAAVSEDGDTPTALVHRQEQVDAGDTLTLHLAGSGGAVAVLRPGAP